MARQDLTQAQQDIVTNAQRDVALVMQRAEYALKTAGVLGFDHVEMIAEAIAYVVERGATSTLEALEYV